MPSSSGVPRWSRLRATPDKIGCCPTLWIHADTASQTKVVQLVDIKKCFSASEHTLFNPCRRQHSTKRKVRVISGHIEFSGPIRPTRQVTLVPDLVQANFVWAADNMVMLGTLLLTGLPDDLDGLGGPVDMRLPTLCGLSGVKGARGEKPPPLVPQGDLGVVGVYDACTAVVAVIALQGHTGGLPEPDEPTRALKGDSTCSSRSMLDSLAGDDVNDMVVHVGGTTVIVANGTVVVDVVGVNSTSLFPLERAGLGDLDVSREETVVGMMSRRGVPTGVSVLKERRGDGLRAGSEQRGDMCGAAGTVTMREGLWSSRRVVSGVGSVVTRRGLRSARANEPDPARIIADTRLGLLHLGETGAGSVVTLV